MTTKLILNSQHLGPESCRILEVTHGPNGRKLSKSLILTIPSAQSKGEENFQRWVIEALSWKMPALIEFALRSKAATELAKRLMRSNSGSQATLYQYLYGVYRYCTWIRKGPDELIRECLEPESESPAKVLSSHVKTLDEFVGELQAEDLAPGTVNNHVKGVKALYRANGLRVELPYKLSRRIKYKDRAPKPEELQRLMDIADLRGKVLISMLALGGFRVGTLVRLQYRHVREDLEKGVIPLHIHVEAEITKGKYADYDTFLGQEAVHYLRLYIDQRQVGSPEGRTPPEDMTDDSPLIRDGHSAGPYPITDGRVHNIIHDLFRRAGLIHRGSERRYNLRPHSLRKYFKTQLEARGVKTDYIEYMMGHKTDTYNDVQGLGVEFLRNMYAASGLSIKPPTQVSKLEMLKAFTRGIGLDPERILTQEALSEPHRTFFDQADREAVQEKSLSLAIKEMIKRELLESIGKREAVSSHA